MLWVLLLHIIALLFWCGALLYLPALIILDHSEEQIALSPPKERRSMARFIFTHIASPAALAAITAGTILFFFNHAVEFWLIVKLGLVSSLVVVHALIGLLLLRVEGKPEKPVHLRCWLLGVVSFVLIAGIIVAVLAKPKLELVS